jgi:Holliday junction resolvasome RuvABC endonuclease subunit
MEKESNFLWGLDLSLTCTGVTIYDLTKKEFVFVGSFNTEKIKKQKNRYHNAIKLKEKADWLDSLKKSYPPYYIAIERGFSHHNVATQTIYRVHGLVNYMFWDCPQEYYPPKLVKSVIVHGSATKEDVAIVINTRYNDIFANEDESDSFAVALTCLIDKGLIEWEKPNWADVKKLRKPKPKKTTKKKVVMD